MRELNTGTKPTRTYTSEEVATIINGAMRLDKQNKALAEELEEARENLGKGDKYKKALEVIKTKSERVCTDTPFTTFKVIINIAEDVLK